MGTPERALVTDEYGVDSDFFDRATISQLYPLTPINVQTLWQESLTSYINRLSAAHHVAPVDLIQTMILPRLERPIFVGKALSLLSALNGGGQFAKQWRDVVKELTKQKSVQYLNMTLWADVIPT